MEEERQGDFIVPLIYSFFCLLVISGGIFLVLYVYSPNLSQPWFPMAAFILIGSPWIFWFLTYTYTCVKACFQGSRVEDRQVSRRGSHAPPRATTMNKSAIMTNASVNEPPMNSTNDERHVHFGAAVVMEADDNRGQSGSGEGHNEGGELSTASSKECEMPLWR